MQRLEQLRLVIVHPDETVVLEHTDQDGPGVPKGTQAGSRWTPLICLDLANDNDATPDIRLFAH